MKPVAELPTSKVKAPIAGDADDTRLREGQRYAYPRLGLDGKGRLWLTYREKFGSRYSSHPGSYWLTFARRLDGDHWTEPIEVHHSDGLLDSRPVLLPHASGGLLIVHNTDGRYTTPERHPESPLHQLPRSARRAGRAETGAARTRAGRTPRPARKSART